VSPVPDQVTALPRQVVVVGAGQAGVQVAESLRTLGFDGTITLVGAEPHPPYHRPPLSKEWLLGTVEAAQLTLRAPEALARKGIDLITGIGAIQIDLQARRVVLADGTAREFDGLALATGARARSLPVPGADASGVVVLRSRDEATSVAAGLDRCVRDGVPLVVIGGGFVGLEVAAAARARGVGVTVLEAQSRLLARALAEPLSAWYADRHTRHGVEVVLGAVVEEIVTGGGHVTGVRLSDGRLVPAGLVLLGVGAEPDDALARGTGLDCDRGIIVDPCGRTSHPGVVAAGDCTATRQPDGSLLRLESVQNAVEQGKAAAAALLGLGRPFEAVPWFWSRQYDVNLQLAGIADGVGRWVTRGDLRTDSFSLYGFRSATREDVVGGAERLVAVQSVNAPRDHLTARKLLAAAVCPASDQVEDLTTDLAALLP
jgi:3-phenylpropionate/trans-cinnamate dioxygenase ferredoxin reductase subunit